jgi:hypothetical protein
LFCLELAGEGWGEEVVEFTHGHPVRALALLFARSLAGRGRW